MEYFLSVSLLILLTSLLFYYLFHHRNGKPIHGGCAATPPPPGKMGFPFLGESLNFFFAGYKGHPEMFVFDRVKRYSSCIFKTHLFGAETVVFCGSSCNKFLFSNENILVRGWWPDTVKKVFPSSGLSTAEETIKMRKMLPNFFKPEALKNYIGVMDEVAQRHFSKEWEVHDQVPVFPLTKEYTFLIACKLFISVEDLEHVEKFAKRFHTLTAGLISIPIDLPGTSFHKAIKASEFIRKELLSIIQKRKIDLAGGKASPTQDIMSLMLSTCDEDGRFMHEMEIADKILGLLVGGHDTASSACASIVKYLAELPDIYDRVYQEQMEIANSKGPGELLNWDDIQKMRYSWNVACEVLRLAPPVQAAFREALTDFTFHGFSIPKGWKIFFSANSTHRNPEYFHDPTKFDPSRFSEGSSLVAPYTFVPFGGGPRMCPGKEYARLEILVFMHHLVKRFKWDKVIPDEKIVIFGITPVPAYDLPVHLHPHNHN